MTGSRIIPDVDTIVGRLRAEERGWADLPLSQRRDLFREISTATAAHAEERVRIAVEIQRLEPASPLVGGEWISGPYAVLGYTATTPRRGGHPRRRCGVRPAMPPLR